MSNTKTAARPGMDGQVFTPVGPITCAIYRRQSQDTTGEGLGVDRQLQECTKLAKQLGWTVVEVFTDNDKSAMKHRPGYEAMLTGITRNRFQGVIAWHADRLYRRLKDLEKLVNVVEGHQVAIRTCQSGELDLSTPYGRMTARILGSVATAEGEHKSARWKLSVQQSRKAGRVPTMGSRMFGWTRDGSLVPKEAEAIRHVVGHVIAGGSIVEACRWLNAQGHRTVHGNEWSTSTLRKLLTNPRIAGYSVLRGAVVTDDEGVPVLGQWDPIIDADTWRALSVFRSTTRKRYPRVALLLGLIHCDRCGARMVTGSQAGWRVYRCPPDPGPRGGCGVTSVKAEPTEVYVEEWAKTKLADESVRRYLAQHVAQDQGDLLDRMQAIRSELAEVEDQLRARREAGRKGRSVTALADLADELEDQLVELENQRDEALALAVAIPEKDEWHEDLGARRRLIGLVIQDVRVLPGTGGRFNPDKRLHVQEVEMGD